MSVLTDKMIADIAIDIPNITKAVIKRYFTEATRKFFFESRRHRHTVKDYQSIVVGRLSSNDFNSVNVGGATTDGKTIWTINRNSNQVTRLSYDTKAEIGVNTISAVSPTGIFVSGENIFITDDDNNTLGFYDLNLVNLGSMPINTRPSGITTTKEFIFIGSDSPFDSAVYIYNIINRAEVAKIVIKDRVSAITISNNKLLVVTGEGSEYENPKLLTYGLNGYTLEKTIALDFLSLSPTSAFSYAGVVYFGLNGKYYAYSNKNPSLAPNGFDIVMIEKVNYINPNNQNIIRVSNTKDEFRDNRRNDRNQNKELTFYQPTNSEIKISHKVNGRIELSVSISPKDYSDIPDYIMTEYWAGIKAGVMSLLYMLPQDWQSTELAVYYGTMFNDTIMQSKEHYKSNIDTFRNINTMQNYGQQQQDVIFED